MLKEQSRYISKLAATVWGIHTQAGTALSKRGQVLTRLPFQPCFLATCDLALMGEPLALHTKLAAVWLSFQTPEQSSPQGQIIGGAGAY